MSRARNTAETIFRFDGHTVLHFRFGRVYEEVATVSTERQEIRVKFTITQMNDNPLMMSIFVLSCSSLVPNDTIENKI